ncbi:phage tail assembly chaperone family protein, TAC [Pseudomonas sp. YH-1]|uniref:phage tail assembly chaperone family protein, TAC n=1 Tax=Pseudomonas sp. YH-1 TaxID=3384787 RepID=UPI003F819E67
MQLSLSSLTKMGAFTGAPVEKEITWKQKDSAEEFKATVFVRPLGYRTAVSDVLAHTGKVDGVAGRIAASICDQDGNPIFSVLDITHGPLDQEALAEDPESTKRLGALDGNLTVALLVAIQEVNAPGKSQASES